MDAEQAYLFRHALVRDAAYGLHLPGERAVLHRLVVEITESVTPDTERDSLAAELATHARFAQAGGNDEMRETELRYIWRAASFATSKFDPQSAVVWLDEAAAKDPDPVRRAQALQRAATALQTSGRAEEGVPRATRAIDLAREAGHQQLQGAATATLAAIHLTRGRFTEAEALFEAALPLARASGDLETEGRTVGNLAAMMSTTNRNEQAFELHKQSLSIHERAGYRHGQAVALGNLGVHLVDLGRTDEALDHFQRAIALNRETGFRRSEGIVLGMLAAMQAGLQQWSEAEKNFTAALQIHREVSNRAYEAWNCCELALVRLAQGREAEACEQWLRGHELMLQWGDGPDLGNAHRAMNKACATAGIAPFIATSGTP